MGGGLEQYTEFLKCLKEPAEANLEKLVFPVNVPMVFMDSDWDRIVWGHEKENKETNTKQRSLISIMFKDFDTVGGVSQPESAIKFLGLS